MRQPTGTRQSLSSSPPRLAIEATYAQHYFEALSHCDQKAAMEVLEGAFRENRSVYQIYSECIVPVTTLLEQPSPRRRVPGSANIDRCLKNRERAREIALNNIELFRAKHSPTTTNGHRITFVSPFEESINFQTRIIADYFAFDGWDVDLQTELKSIDSLVSFLTDHDSKIVAICASRKGHFSEIARFAKLLRRAGLDTQLLVTGPAVDSFPEIAEHCGAEFLVREPTDVLRCSEEVRLYDAEVHDLGSYLKAIGGRVQRFRKGRNMSQQVLADRAELDRTYISALENGKQNATIQALMKIAAALGVPFQRLLIEPLSAQQDGRSTEETQEAKQATTIDEE